MRQDNSRKITDRHVLTGFGADLLFDGVITDTDIDQIRDICDRVSPGKVMSDPSTLGEATVDALLGASRFSPSHIDYFPPELHTALAAGRLESHEAEYLDTLVAKVDKYKYN